MLDIDLSQLLDLSQRNTYVRQAPMHVQHVKINNLFYILYNACNEL